MMKSLITHLRETRFPQQQPTEWEVPRFPDLADRHLVGGEGACLVGADDGGAAQSLHGGQAPHDCVFLGHPAGAQGQAGGNDCGKACGGRGQS